MARILIIDDHGPFRESLRDMLERAGYEVIEAINGQEGIDKYKEEPTDLVIIDILIPVENGFVTIEELKKDFPDVKIIAMSGGSFGKPKGSLLSTAKYLTGIQHTFIKPFEMDEMLKAVEALV